MSEKNIVPISIPGIHQAFWPYFVENTNGEKIKVLDCGAGHGAFTKKLYERVTMLAHATYFLKSFTTTK